MSVTPTVSPRVLPAALATLVVIAYANALEVGFVWDDRAVVLHDPAVTTGQPLAQTFTRSFWPESDLTRAFFRPVTTLSYRLDWLLHGDNPAGYHLANVCLHVVASLLLFSAARRLGARSMPAFLASLAWALSPRLTETVTWISGRTDVLAAVFSFGALCVWPWGVRSAWRASLAAALVVLGLLSKEVALASAIAIVAGEAARGTHSPPPDSWSLRERLARLVPLGVGLLAYGGLRVNALVSVDGTVDGIAGVGPRLGAAATALGRYAWMLLDPFRPRLQMGLVSGVEPGFVVVGAVVSIALLAGAVALFPMGSSRSARPLPRGVAVGFALAVAAVALVLHLVPIPVNVSTADRFMYFPLAGIALAASAWASRLGDSHVRVARAAGASTLAFAAIAGVVTHLRNDEWADEIRLWSRSVQEVGDENTTPVIELGNVLFRASAHTRALALYAAAERRLATAPGPAHRRALANVGATLGALGRYADALAVRRHLVQRYPGVGVLYMDLARAELHVLDFANARAALDAAERVNTPPAEVEQFRRLLSELEADAPNAAGTGTRTAGERVQRARFDSKAGRIPEALEAWRTVVRSPGSAGSIDPASLKEAASFLARFGTVDDLRGVLDRVTADPRLADEAPHYRNALFLREASDAQLRAAEGDIERAIARLR